MAQKDSIKVLSIRQEILRKPKKVQSWLFFGHFWNNFGYASEIPASYDFDAIAHIGP